jgi:hypothetical protein
LKHKKNTKNVKKVLTGRDSNAILIKLSLEKRDEKSEKESLKNIKEKQKRC